jgi:hypothetical protein
MALLSSIELLDPDKLHILRRLDQFRVWQSLDDKRYCLSCGKLISGRDIMVVGGTRGNGPLRIICPTKGCHSIPMDWVLPTDEVLAKNSELQLSCIDTAAATLPTDLPKRRLRTSLRKLATRLGGVAVITLLI